MAIKDLLSNAKKFLEKKFNKFTKRAYDEVSDRKQLKKEITKTIDSSIKKGDNAQSMFSSIKMKAKKLKNRLKLIVRTEATRIENLTRLEVIKLTQTKEKGKKTVKVWNTKQDDRVRDQHRSMQGEEAEVNSKFSNGLLYPGDPAGDMSQICNCRCWITKRVVDEAKDFPDEMPKELTFPKENDIIDSGGEQMNENISGAISGALNPESKEAEEHAKQYYESVRSMKTDYIKIAKNVNMSEKDILLIKNHIFIKEHNLGGKLQRFDSDYEMAQSWQRLIEGKNIQEKDIVLLNHELIELKLMENGITQDEAHIIASEKYNYSNLIKKER